MMLQDFVLRNFLLIKFIFKKKKPSKNIFFLLFIIIFFSDNFEMVSAQTVWKIMDGLRKPSRNGARRFGKNRLELQTVFYKLS
jgi:hypothetical protein